VNAADYRSATPNITIIECGYGGHYLERQMTKVAPDFLTFDVKLG
jgi:hypothetical protein